MTTVDVLSMVNEREYIEKVQSTRLLNDAMRSGERSSH